MLNQISIWQMVIDVGLVTSILVMAFRYAKSTKIPAMLPRLVELEGRLDTLVAEAEARAQHINDQLLRREQSLTKRITEIEKRENDMTAAMSSGEELAKEISLLCESARREAVEIERIVVEARSLRDADSSRKVEVATQDRVNARGTQSQDLHPETAEHQRFSTRGDSRRASEWLEDAADIQPRKEATKQDRFSLKSLQDSYTAAEEMLKQGRDAQEVSMRTSLPIEGVQRLAQMIEIEREEEVVTTHRHPAGRNALDPRLGALGVSRRPTPAA